MQNPYAIRLKKSAAKEFKKLPKRIQAQILDAFKVLETNPRTEILKIKKLRGLDAIYRLSLGDYRLIYECSDQELIILVIKIGHSSDVYRNK